MPRVGFEPTIPLFQRAKAVHSLECAATVIGNIRYDLFLFSTLLNRRYNVQVFIQEKAEFVSEQAVNARSTFQQVSHLLAPISILIVQDPLALCLVPQSHLTR
jgi:hypothetical protein